MRRSRFRNEVASFLFIKCKMGNEEGYTSLGISVHSQCPPRRTLCNSIQVLWPFLTAEDWTQIPEQAPRNLPYKLTPSIPLSLEREGEAEGGGEFI
jgi:hypothetical protein